jgi:two-component system nitrate/nitrite sensor histidine kinase NarX
MPKKLKNMVPMLMKKPVSTEVIAFSDRQSDYRNIFEAAGDGLILYNISTGQVVDANPAACAMHGYSMSEFIGLNPIVFMRSEPHTIFLEHIRTAEADIVLASLDVHFRKDGSAFHVDVRRSLVNFRGDPCVLSIIRDVSQRIEAERLQNRHLEARRREQATLLAISHTLASTLELQPGLILDQLREIIEFTHGGLFALDGAALVALAIRGTPLMNTSMPFRIHLEDPQTLVALFNRHQPIIIANIWSSDPQAQLLRSLLQDGAGVLLDGMKSWMWVPLAVKGRIIGGVGVAQTSRNYFTSHHADLALSVANQAAITMINSELYGQAQALAVLEERQSLARNLHDAINQSLFSAGLIAEVLPRLWERDQAEARRSLEDLRRLTRGAQAEMRALLAELRPSTLTDSNLGDLLRLLGNALSGRINIPINVTVIGEGRLPAEIQVAIYRICQEALTNIAKHAKATKVQIDLRHGQQPESLELHISDNGRGFDTFAKPVSGHYGLGMIHERAETAGLELVIASQPGQGTELKIHWSKDMEKNDNS